MNEEDMLPIPAGSIFTVTTGELSSYGISGVFRAVSNLDPESLRESYLVEYPEQREEYCFRGHTFLAWLARRGLIETVPCLEWHLYDYGCAGEMRVYDLVGS